MSIVSEFKLPLAEDESGQVIAYSVSNTVTHPIVAVAVKCKVIFFSDSGQKMSFVMQK